MPHVCVAVILVVLTQAAVLAVRVQTKLMVVEAARLVTRVMAARLELLVHHLVKLAPAAAVVVEFKAKDIVFVAHDKVAVLAAAVLVFLVKVLVARQSIKILTDHAPSRAAEEVLLALMALTAVKIVTQNRAKVLVGRTVAVLVAAIVNEALMEPFVLSGPDAHVPSPQLALGHLNFLEIT